MLPGKHHRQAFVALGIASATIGGGAEKREKPCETPKGTKREACIPWSRKGERSKRVTENENVEIMFL